MSSGACEQRELMKLFKCVLDTGIDVLSAFFTLKVLSLPKNGRSFTQFLDNEKHFLYHQWEQRKIMCCACPQFGCSIGQSSKMKNWIFQILYEANGTEDPAHIIKRSGRLQQLCLHKFETRSIDAHELDITVLSFLLRLFAKMSASEISSLDAVNLCRNSICHARSTNGFSMAKLNIMWADLETHLINLSDLPYQRIIKKQIQNCRKYEIDKEDIAELSNRINSMEIVVDDIHCHLNNGYKNVTQQVKEFEKKSMNGNLQLQKRQEENHNSVSEKLEHQHAEMIKMREIQEQTNEEIIKMRESHEVMLQFFINNVQVDVNYDDPGQKDPSDKMAKESAVLMNIKTPRDWNDKDVAQRIKDYERMSNKQDITTKFVRVGSLIILTAVPYGILHDKVKYENAIKMFMTRMMDVCNIDTERECQLKATLHILEHDEVDIKHSYVLCEDKATQISIPQADKGFQINSYECDEQMGPEGLVRKRILKFDESIDDDNRFQPYHHSNDETSHHSPSRRSCSNSSLPVDDVLYSNSSPHISLYDKASGFGTRSLRRANSASGDSSYGSTASMAGSFRSIGGYFSVFTPSKATADTINKSSSIAYLPEKWPEIKNSLREQKTSSSASLYLPRQWKGSTPELKSLEEPTTLSSASPYLPRKWKEPEYKESVEEIEDMIPISWSSETKKRSKKCSIQ